MKCLCCGREFTPKASIEEVESGWHKKCVKAFFGSTKLPTLDISEETLKKHRNLCGRIRKILTSSCIIIENKIK